MQNFVARVATRSTLFSVAGVGLCGAVASSVTVHSNVRGIFHSDVYRPQTAMQNWWPWAVQRKEISHPLAKWTPGEILELGIVAANVAVLVAWRVVPSGVMSRWMTDQLTNPLVSMVGSVWSHQSPLHLAFNMMAMHSFMPLAIGHLSRKHVQDDRQRKDWNVAAEYAALWAAAGLFASLASRYVRCLRLLRRDNAALSVSSLGASGALYGVLSYCAVGIHETNEQVQLSVIFVPTVSVDMWDGWRALCLFDAVMIVVGWRTGLDHAAHLGGALCGYLYARYQVGVWEWMCQQSYQVMRRVDLLVKRTRGSGK